MSVDSQLIHPTIPISEIVEGAFVCYEIKRFTTIA